MNDIIQLDNQYYIAVNSSYTDNRIKVLNHIDSFGIFDRWGDIRQLGEQVQGIYHKGMRYISALEMRINGKRPVLLSSTIKDENEILSVDLTNPMLTMSSGQHIPADVLHLGRSKIIRNGNCLEQIRISNYGGQEFEFEISFSIEADLRDIFEIRGIKRESRGEISEISHSGGDTLRICYKGKDHVERITCMRFYPKPHQWTGPGQALFRCRLKPHEETIIEYTISFLEGSAEPSEIIFDNARRQLSTDLESAGKLIANIRTSNEQLNGWINRSRNDLISLLSITEHGRYPYAGVPWYNTAFGRDGIITALGTLWVAPGIARDVLKYLSATQAREADEYRDAEPGKIIHEVRGGEMAELNEIPFKEYYGSVDGTPLFVSLAAAYFNRTQDIELIKQIWPNIKAALQWIDEYGDIDGDGFVEYQHKSKTGLTNQGWKDSHDSVMHRNGMQANAPIALCEVQSYVYDAWMGATVLARAMNDENLAVNLEQKAAVLKKTFNEKFWDEELGTYVLALDGHKQPCRVVASNAGHCLLSSIADKEKAAILVKRMMQPDMFNGWGIRTLSEKEECYNPMSYHNGSVWPHDVALIAKGMSKYGYMDEAIQLMSSLMDAAGFIESYRLPELFCGFSRRKGEGPTSYPVACSPQAWAVASVYMLIEACLHIDIYAKDQKLYIFNPALPQGIEHVEIRDLDLDGNKVNLQLSFNGGSCGLKVEDCPKGWQVFLISEKENSNNDVRTSWLDQ